MAIGLSRLFARAYQVTLAKPLMREILIGIAIFFALVAVMQVGLVPQRIKAVAGRPAEQEVLAPRDIRDPFMTEKRREEARRRARLDAELDPANWYIAPESGVHAAARLDEFVRDVAQARAGLSQAVSAGGGDNQILAKLRQKWVGVTTAAWEGLLMASADQFAQWQQALEKILVAVEESERISDLNLRSFRESLPQAAARYGWNPNDHVLLGTLRGLVTPNLILDQAKVDSLVRQADQATTPFYYRTGEPILTRGEIVTQDKLRLLKSLGMVAGSNVPLAYISLILFVLVLIALAVGYLYRFRPETLRQERLMYLLAVTLIIAAIMGKFFAVLSPEATLAFFAPVTFASILWILLLDSQVALMMTVLLSLLMGVVTGFRLSFTIYVLIGGSVSIFVLAERQQRADLIKNGFFVSCANVFTVILLMLLSGEMPPLREVGLRLALAAFNGVTAAVIAIGLLPFLENLFGLTSTIRLLELANPNQPLLRQLLVEAPGTYHHSIIVGNLAEAAADSVGADALLARVGAYYHDIGKVKRPYFFTENQIAQDNPHEKLTPTLSTLIITAHVKEGVEMARQAGLPENVVDILEQHHGTDLVRYFYARAAENTQADLAETDFRYDGPRPQSKEAALIMLADSVEAAVRAMAKPTPAKIEALITRIIKERLDDGQFDECDLTLRDLDRIGSTFLKVLGGIFHTRLEYPESIIREFERKKGANADPRKQPAG